MKKSNLIKVFSIVVVSLMVILFNTNVFAADSSEDFNDLTSTLSNSSSNTTGNNTTGNNTSGNNTSGNNTSNTSKNNTSNNTSKATANNSSVYNNTNLPKTGIGDSIPVAMLVVIFGISAVYAYKKVSDYRNI